MSLPNLAVARTEDRLEHIDLIRGYALLGVLLMNIQYWFRNPPQLYWMNPHPFPGALNVATDHLLKIFFEAKSVTIFSMLFAIGLCMQRDSILAKGGQWLSFGFRRLAIMVGLGALHITLLWMGDVLHQYALAGLLILPFLKREAKTLTWWLRGVLGLALLAIIGFSIAMMIKGLPNGGGPGPKEREEMTRAAQALVQGYSQHSWWGVLKVRVMDYVQVMAGNLPPIILVTWVNFLVGLRIWKSGLLQNPETRSALLGRLALVGLGVGLPLSLLSDLIPKILAFMQAHWTWARLGLPLFGIAQIFGPLFLGVGIMFGLTWLWNQPKWRNRLRPLTYVGRMGFSNYILQSVICTFVFYGYGLGLYNKVGPALGTLIGLAIFWIQIPLSRWWLGQFRFGPMEWLWRTLSYGKRQPMRRSQALEATVVEA